MFNTHGALQGIFTQAIKAAFPDLETPEAQVTVSSNDKFGDYQCNNAMDIGQVNKCKSNTQNHEILESLLFHGLEILDLEVAFYFYGLEISSYIVYNKLSF